MIGIYDIERVEKAVILRNPKVDLPSTLNNLDYQQRLNSRYAEIHPAYLSKNQRNKLCRGRNVLSKHHGW